MTHPTTRSYPRDLKTAFRHLSPDYACAVERTRKGKIPWKALAYTSLLALGIFAAGSAAAEDSWTGKDAIGAWAGNVYVSQLGKTTIVAYQREF